MVEFYLPKANSLESPMFVLSRPVASSNVLTDSLIAFWELESDGSDSSKNGNDMVAVNTPSYSAGVVGNSADYTDGDGDYHYFPYTSGATPEGTAFTLIFWQYMTTGYDGNPSVLYFGNAAQTEFVYRVLISGGSMFLYVYSTGTSLAGTTSRSGVNDAWRMCTITYDGVNTSRISLNAGAFASVTAAINSRNDAQLRFGNGFDIFQATQSFDQIALYDRVLTQNEIDWHYNGGIGRSYADALAYNPLIEFMVAFWEFEADGSDSSANGFDLTAYNTPTYNAGLVNNATDLVYATQQYFDILDSETTSLNGELFEFAFWAYLDGSTINTTHTLLNKKSAFNNVGCEYQLQIQDATTTPALNLWIGDGVNFRNVISNTFNANEWVFVRFGWDGTNVFLRINNGVASTASLSTTLNTTGDLTIGRNSPGSTFFFDGKIDSLGFWKSYNLTDADADFLYNSGNGRSYTQIENY